MRTTIFIVACALCFFSQVNGYTVTGNKIYDPNGDQVLLRGVDRCSLEWSVTGEQLSLSDYSLMKGWGANVVRVSLSQDSWLANSGGYQTTVEQQATWINSLGMGVIFDLHWNQGGQQVMADQNSITFWTQMAQTFGSNPWVIFELYNEPHDVPWTTWLSGDGNWAGMQQLYNAVRVAGGASNLVIVCGLNWAFDLSGVATYPVVGTNIAYGAHPYDYGGKQSGDWPAAFGYLVSTYPIIMTEFGQYCNTDTYVSDLLAYAQANGIHWTAWAWYVNGCSFPSIISDWTGTPYPGVGVTVKAYLGGSGTTGSVTTASATTATATTGAPPPASTALAIYTDSLQNGFQSWSWGNTPNFASAAQVHSGSYSIQLPVGDYGAIYFHATTNFYLGAYSSFDFYIYPDSSSITSSFFVILYDSGTNAVGSPKSFSATANTWNHVTIQTSQFGVSLSTLLSGVAIQANVDADSGNIYVDDVQFLPATGSTTTATTTTTAKATTTTTAAVTTTTTTTTKPTTTTTTTAAATTTSTTAKPTTTTTTTTTSTTTKPTTTTTTTSTATTGSSSCGASSITVVQTPGTSWQSGGVTITQYAVTISSSCTTKTLTSLSFTLGNWNPLSGGYWGFSVSGSTGTLPSYATITAASPYTGIGYQNQGGVATFTVLSYTFQ